MTSLYRVNVNFDSSIEVAFEADTTDLIKKVVQDTLKSERIAPPAEVTILITSDETLRLMNHNYRGINNATDVLSFPSGDEIEGAEGYLGDIAISAQFANNQAKISGHSLKAELLLLSVHATLHLLGYDHDTLEQKEGMWSKQAAILHSAGLEQIRLPE